MGHFIVLLIVVLPLATLIHLLGSVFFIRTFQGKISRIALGAGSTIFRMKNLEVKSIFFIGGEYSYVDLKINTKLSRILILLGGTIFSAISSILLFNLLSHGLLPKNYITNSLFMLLCLNSVTGLLPVTIGGTDTAGKQVWQLFKREKLNKMLKDEKSHPKLIFQIDAEIARLRKASESSGYEFMRGKYIREVFYKSRILEQMGRTEDAIDALKEIYFEISKEPSSMQIIYYNNLLYDCIIAKCSEDIDEIYNKLVELLSKEENKAYETDNIIDTLETYKLYKSRLE